MDTKMVKRIFLVGCEAFSILISLYFVLWAYRKGSLLMALVFFVIEALPPILLLVALFRPGGVPSKLIVQFGTALPALCTPCLRIIDHPHNNNRHDLFICFWIFFVEFGFPHTDRLDIHGNHVVFMAVYMGLFADDCQ